MKEFFRYEIPCDEAKIQKTIEVSQRAFIAGEGERPMSQLEFLYQQSRYIKKYWWLLQGALLLAVCGLLRTSNSPLYSRRSLGVAAPLFVILVLPELWKNRSANATEVEGTTYYTLRQIYAARLTLFAGVDLVLLTLFFLGAAFSTRVTLWELMIQFLLPFLVACCICFRCLYSSRAGSEVFSILLCSVWTGLWVLVVASDSVYNAVSVPVWIAALAGAAVYLAFSAGRVQREYRKLWEAKPSWN